VRICRQRKTSEKNNFLKSGKEVQKAHMRLARKKKHMPVFDLPGNRGNIGISDVLRANPRPERDRAIKEWSASVWEA